ncbi:MAG: hypothetical protein R3D28_21260 [Geminicoccaceae bacterium]
METGLHIGLAAWLHDHCDRAGFPAWPAAPVGLSLASLERAENAADMAAVAEFARLVNFVAHRGQPARPFDAAAPLWRVHAALLSRMGFAERAWTEAENASFLAARATLYLPGGGMTSLYRLYQECRAAHRDLARLPGPMRQRCARRAWPGRSRRQAPSRPPLPRSS